MRPVGETDHACCGSTTGRIFLSRLMVEWVLGTLAYAMALCVELRIPARACTNENV